MISDSLFDCIEEMKDYIKRFPETYSAIEPRLNHLMSEMDDVRAHLDRSPALDGLPDLIAWPHDHRIRLFPTSEAGLRALMAEPSHGRYGVVVLTHNGADCNSEFLARACAGLRVGQCSGEVATTLAAVSAWRQGGSQSWLPL
jgi:hypothetical protein